LRWPIHNHIHNMGLDCLRGIYLGARELRAIRAQQGCRQPLRPL